MYTSEYTTGFKIFESESDYREIAEASKGSVTEISKSMVSATALFLLEAFLMYVQLRSWPLLFLFSFYLAKINTWFP